MKVKVFFLTFILLSACFCLHAQVVDRANIVCQYRLTFVRNANDAERISNDFMILEIGAKSSKFYSYNQFLGDSLKAADQKNGTLNPYDPGRYKGNGITYTIHYNYPNGSITNLDKVSSNQFVYAEPLETPQWNIEADTLTVLSYLCQKATCRFRGRDYTAWFTTDVPVSYGPWKLNGLPGLVLKANDSEQHYSFECVGIKKVQGEYPIVFNNEECVKTTGKDFHKAKRKYHEDPIGYFEATWGKKLEVSDRPKNLSYNPIERDEK